MVELLDAVASWRSLLLALLFFGFAPGFFLRLIVLAYRHADPRRDELIAELYAVPRIQRPWWVAEQLETALFEGFRPRVSAAIRRLATQLRKRAAHRQLADRLRKPARTDQRGDQTSLTAHVRDGPEPVAEFSELVLF